ncbi:hypothetical protein [Arsenophonus sp.]|uniref:hypothetical protein n=1 Tax=Arsenophonus sp. TaxID=1872640 RepID=UPI0038794D48
MTITAIHNTGGDPIKYKFTLQKWYVYSGDQMNWNSATNWCSKQTVNMKLPTVEQISIGRFQYGIGSLWSEWGNTSFYGWNNHMYWTSKKSGNTVDTVGMVSGFIGTNTDNEQLFFTCISDL